MAHSEVEIMKRCLNVETTARFPTAMITDGRQDKTRQDKLNLYLIDEISPAVVELRALPTEPPAVFCYNREEWSDEVIKYKLVVNFTVRSHD